MTISIGRGIAARNSTLDAPNRGIAGVATDRLRATVSRANQRHEEALRVDGLHAHVWIKTGAGLRCTCSASQINTVPNPAKPRSAPVAVSGPQVRVREIIRERVDRPLPANSSALAGIVAEVNAAQDNNDPAGDSELDAIVAAAEAMHLDRDSASRRPNEGPTLGGLDMSRCGICLGTGRVEGYQMHGGARYVLDASDTWPFTMEGWTFEHTRPRAWVCDADDARASVTWTVDLPAYFMRTVVRARNNTRPALGLVLEMRSGSDAWQPLTDATLMARRGMNNLLEIRVRPMSGFSAQGTLRFTHIEMHFEFVEMPRGDMPQLLLNDGLEYYEPIINTNMELSATVSGVERGSVIGESRYGHLWKVTDVTNHQTGARQLFNVELQLRMLQRWELLYLLNLYRRADVDLELRRDARSVHPSVGREASQGGPIDGDESTMDLNTTNPSNLMRG